MAYEAKVAKRQWQNSVNNAQGHIFEGCIKTACLVYAEQGRAKIEKIPEPFRVTAKGRDGTFMGRFTALAQPDFQGTLAGGRSIVFEAKYTTTDRIRREVLTQEQMQALEYHHRMGAVAGVCVGIKDQSFFVPWPIWDSMKEQFGRKYATARDLEPYRVKFNGAVMFLDVVNPQREKGGESHEHESYVFQ